MLTSSAFWKATAERAVRTFAQALLGVIGANATGVLDADWLGALSAAAMAAVLAILTAVASSGSGGPGLTETPTADVVAKVDGGRTVAADASPIANGTPVVVSTGNAANTGTINIAGA